MLDVLESRELQAVILALRQMDRTLRKAIYKETRTQVTPDWRQELAANATTSLEGRVLANGARADVTESTVRLKAAQSVRKMAGGASPREIGHAVEFGADWRRAEITATSSAGKTYTYSRVVNKQLRPRRSAGYVVFPAAARLAPRYISLWVQTTVRKLHEAFEGKSS